MESQLQQLQQMQQQQQQMQEQQQQPQGNRNQQQQQPKHFIPIQSERVISPSGGVMIRHATNKTHLTANAVIGISVPHNSHNNLNSMVVPITEPSEPLKTTPTTSAPTAPTTTTTIATTSATTTTPVPLVGMVQDVIFSMILNVPALRTKLQVILDNPSLIGDEISKVYAELQSKLTPQELQQLNAYAGQDSSRRTLGSVMQSAFANIMADGKIDMSDAPHFLTLIHDCITLFSENATAAAASVTLNSNTVITFLHFVLKCILILTLDEPEETAALVMLDGSFRLVKLTVLPLISGKKWCCCFS
jgi:hypothetical protein